LAGAALPQTTGTALSPLWARKGPIHHESMCKLRTQVFAGARLSCLRIVIATQSRVAKVAMYAGK